MSSTVRAVVGRVLVVALAAAVLGTFPSATEASATEASADQESGRGDHTMGSQIAKHEADRAESGESEADSSGVQGIDVSRWQDDVDWDYWWERGKRFAYVKATEGVGYRSPTFADQYNGSAEVGMIRGAYHFALPDVSGGAKQANYFVDNGGGWSSDGKTLPGVVDLEYNPYGDSCYGRSRSAMAAWIQDFSATYHRRTGRYPVIYTSTNWWNSCVGDARSFTETSPLWIARYSESVGDLPGGWNYHTFWQYSDDPIDQNRFNGSRSRLKELADNAEGSANSRGSANSQGSANSEGSATR